jgi:hypothetical protein
MDADRLYRFLTPGWALICSLVFNSWVVGLDVAWIWKLPDSKVVLAGLIAIASGPLLGLIAHVIAVNYFLLLRGRQQHFLIPVEQGEFRSWVANLTSNLTAETLRTRVEKAGEAIMKNFHPTKRGLHKGLRRSSTERELWMEANRYFWTHAPDGIRSFVVRGWTLYWSLMNSVIAYLIGLLFALSIHVYALLSHRVAWSSLDPSLARFSLWFVLFALFFVLACYAEAVLRPDAREMAARQIIGAKNGSTGSE